MALLMPLRQKVWDSSSAKSSFGLWNFDPWLWLCLHLLACLRFTEEFSWHLNMGFLFYKLLEMYDPLSYLICPDYQTRFIYVLLFVDHMGWRNELNNNWETYYSALLISDVCSKEKKRLEWLSTIIVDKITLSYIGDPLRSSVNQLQLTIADEEIEVFQVLNKIICVPWDLQEAVGLYPQVENPLCEEEQCSW